MSARLRAYLLAGLVLWLPILITFYVISFLIELLDQSMALLPMAYRPDQLLGHHIPGFGVMLSLIVLLLSGAFAKNFLGERLVHWGEALLRRIPLVRSVYNTVKQIINSVLASNSQAFRQVLLVEYPAKGVWSIGFQTGSTNDELKVAGQQDFVSVFIPTTPNPTSGFLTLIPKGQVVPLSMSVDEALKYIISLGVMQSASQL